MSNFPPRQQVTALEAAPWQPLTSGTPTKMTLAVDSSTASTYLKAKAPWWNQANNLLMPRAMEETLLVGVTFSTKLGTLQTATRVQIRFKNLASGRAVRPNRSPMGGTPLGITDISLLGVGAEEDSLLTILSPTTPDTMTKGWQIEATSNGSCSIMLNSVTIISLG